MLEHMIKTLQEGLFFFLLPKEERRLCDSPVHVAMLGRHEMCVHHICPLHGPAIHKEISNFCYSLEIY